MTAETINTISNVVTGVSTLGFTLIALFTVKSWKSQFIHQRKAKLASKSLVLAYRANDAIRSIRVPWGWSEEGKSRKRAPDETEEESRQLDKVYVAYERLSHYDDLFAKLSMHSYMMIAEFGKEHNDVFAPVFEFRHQITASTREASEFIYDRRRRKYVDEQDKEEAKAESEARQKFTKLRWQHGEDDEINQRLLKMIDDLETLNKSLR